MESEAYKNLMEFKANLDSRINILTNREQEISTKLFDLEQSLYIVYVYKKALLMVLILKDLPI
jgi:chaperonin cofactor prefoldin